MQEHSAVGSVLLANNLNCLSLYCHGLLRDPERITAFEKPWPLRATAMSQVLVPNITWLAARRRAASPRSSLTGRTHLLLILDCSCCPVLVPCLCVCRRQRLVPPPPLPSSLLASSMSGIFYSMGSRVANLAMTERSRHFTAANREKDMPYCFTNGTSWHPHVLSSAPTTMLAF